MADLVSYSCSLVNMYILHIIMRLSYASCLSIPIPPSIWEVVLIGCYHHSNVLGEWFQYPAKAVLTILQASVKEDS